MRSVLDAMPQVKAIEPDLIYEPLRFPDDPLFTSQWFHDNTGQFVVDPFGWFTGFGVPGADISSAQAWDITIGSRDVIVAVIDTGVDIDHPDLAGEQVREPRPRAGQVEHDTRSEPPLDAGIDFDTQVALPAGRSRRRNQTAHGPRKNVPRATRASIRSW